MWEVEVQRPKVFGYGIMERKSETTRKEGLIDRYEPGFHGPDSIPGFPKNDVYRPRDFTDPVYAISFGKDEWVSKRGGFARRKHGGLIKKRKERKFSLVFFYFAKESKKMKIKQ